MPHMVAAVEHVGVAASTADRRMGMLLSELWHLNRSKLQ
jgi:hypothetical protein